MKELPPAAGGSVHVSKTIEDSVLASSLITAPAWGPWLSELNDILTTLSLLVGLAIGLHRLWRIHSSSGVTSSGKPSDESNLVKKTRSTRTKK